MGVLDLDHEVHGHNGLQMNVEQVLNEDINAGNGVCNILEAMEYFLCVLKLKCLFVCCRCTTT